MRDKRVQSYALVENYALEVMQLGLPVSLPAALRVSFKLDQAYILYIGTLRYLRAMKLARSIKDVL